MRPGESVRFEQEVWFDSYQLGSASGIVGGEIEIRRGSDGHGWSGSAFVAAAQWIATTVDASGLFHYYDFVFPSAADEFYNIRVRIAGDAATESVGTAIVRTGGADGGIVFIPVFDD